MPAPVPSPSSNILVVGRVVAVAVGIVYGFSRQTYLNMKYGPAQVKAGDTAAATHGVAAPAHH